MRRAMGIASAIVVVAGTLLIPAASASASSSDDFRGTWVSIDPGDGSNQSLRIGGSGAGGKHSIFYQDDLASVACGGGPANVQGSGTVDGDTLTWFFTISCPGTGRPPVNGLVGPGFFTYNPNDDTLVDDAGAVWSRA